MLVAPLDWGLGHSTRLIPIIERLIETGCTVIIAAEGKQKTLLELEFPQLLFIPLTGYRVQYTKSKRLLPIKILGQLPKISKSIKKEHQWLKETVSVQSIDAVISDNRYGLWHSTIPSIFITHQLQVKGPNKWIEILMRKVNYQHINRFTACWVPDFEGIPNLAGSLSHPEELPLIPIKYVGALSRFELRKNVEIKYDLLIILSGPEPQRTILEERLLIELKRFQGTALFVRGLPGSNQQVDSFNKVSIVNHLPATELELAFQQSNLIIARAGYTTVMDVVKLHKKSILIPTPGQTEQEYLAIHLQQQNICLSFRQKDFNLQTALDKTSTFNYRLPEFNMNMYRNLVDEFITSLG